MTKVTLEVPEEVAVLLKAMEKKLRAERRAAQAFRDVDPEGAFKAIEDAATALTLDMKRRVLQGYDADTKRVSIGGKRYVRVLRSRATYKTRQGPVEVERNLFREEGKRNPPTVDAVSLRAGCVEDGWLPETATAMAYLLANGTSREAERTAKEMRTLPYSRPSFERLGHAVAEQYGRERARVEKALAEGLQVPEKAHSVSISLDRVALPMEEPRARAVGRPKKGAPKRPVEVVWRMAYAGCVTIHDGDGEGLKTLRYGAMPQRGGKELAERMAGDVRGLLRQEPKLLLCVLTDGAPELHNLLDGALATHVPDTAVSARLVDFWHLVEKLAPAAQLLAPESPSQLRARWKMALLNQPGAAWKLVTELDASGKRHIKCGDKAPVHEALTYLENHGERMRYAEARADGLPIGSGNVEATCKSLVAVRMKRPGARWKEDSGQHVMDLRSLVLSERYDEAVERALKPLKAKVRKAA